MPFFFFFLKSRTIKTYHTCVGADRETCWTFTAYKSFLQISHTRCCAKNFLFQGVKLEKITVTFPVLYCSCLITNTSEIKQELEYIYPSTSQFHWHLCFLKLRNPLKAVAGWAMPIIYLYSGMHLEKTPCTVFTKSVHRQLRWSKIFLPLQPPSIAFLLHLLAPANSTPLARSDIPKVTSKQRSVRHTHI